MTETPAFEIVALDGIEARLDAWCWPFAETERERIEAHWRELTTRNPALFNGRVLLQHQSRMETTADGSRVLHARYFETDYAAFVARRALGRADGVRNGFAMAALQGNDGAYLLGLMGPRTFNAGKVYFAAGTPDLDDLTADGNVDLAGSVSRELEEETGLTPDDVEAAPGWTAVIGSDIIAFMRAMTIDLPAEAARMVIRSRIAQQIEPELADIVIVRSLADIDEARMPPYMQAYLRWAFGAYPAG